MNKLTAFLPSDSVGGMDESWEMVDKGESSAENVTSKENKGRTEVIDQTHDDIDDIVMVNPEQGEQLRARSQIETAIHSDHHEEVIPAIEDHFMSETILKEGHLVSASPVNENNLKSTYHAKDNRKVEQPATNNSLFEVTKGDLTTPVNHPQITTRHAIKLQTEYEMDTDEEEDLLSPRSFADVQRMLAGYRDSEVRSVKIYTPEELSQIMQKERKDEEQAAAEIESGKKEEIKQDREKEFGKKGYIWQEKVKEQKEREGKIKDKSMKSSESVSEPLKVHNGKGKGLDEDKPVYKVIKNMSTPPEEMTDSKKSSPDGRPNNSDISTPSKQRIFEVEELFDGDTSSDDDTSGDEGGEYTLDYTLEDIEEAITDQVIFTM